MNSNANTSRLGSEMDTVVPMIYVVDDDESVRKALSRLFRSVGYSVEAYDSALSFITDCSIQSQACLVLDISMPGMTGLELVDYLNERSREIPIVLITAQEEIYSQGVSKPMVIKCLNKPLDAAELLKVIENALKSSQL